MIYYLKKGIIINKQAVAFVHSYSLGYGGNLPVGGRNNFVHMNFRKNAILEAFPCVSRPNILKTIKEEKFKDGNVIYLQATM